MTLPKLAVILLASVLLAYANFHVATWLIIHYAKWMGWLP